MTHKKVQLHPDIPDGRKRRSAQSRAKLCAGAAALMLRRDAHDITALHIAEESGVSLRTLFHLFGGPNEVFGAAIDVNPDLARRLVEKILGNLASEATDEAVQRIARSYATGKIQPLEGDRHD